MQIQTYTGRHWIKAMHFHSIPSNQTNDPGVDFAFYSKDETYE